MGVLALGLRRQEYYDLMKWWCVSKRWYLVATFAVYYRGRLVRSEKRDFAVLNCVVPKKYVLPSPLPVVSRLNYDSED